MISSTGFFTRLGRLAGKSFISLGRIGMVIGLSGRGDLLIMLGKLGIQSAGNRFYVKNYNKILNEMVKHINTNMDTSPGSTLRNLLEAIAHGIASNK